MHRLRASHLVRRLTKENNPRRLAGRRGFIRRAGEPALVEITFRGERRPIAPFQGLGSPAATRLPVRDPTSAVGAIQPSPGRKPWDTAPRKLFPFLAAASGGEEGISISGPSNPGLTPRAKLYRCSAALQFAKNFIVTHELRRSRRQPPAPRRAPGVLVTQTTRAGGGEERR